MRTRPKRSGKVPENHPPSDDISKVVATRAVLPRDSPQSAITVGSQSCICTSKASNAQPPKHALMVRRSPTFNLPDQASIAFLPRSLITGMLACPMRRCDGILLWLPMPQRQLAEFRSAGGAHLHVGAGGVLYRLEPAVARVPRRH